MRWSSGGGDARRDDQEHRGGRDRHGEGADETGGEAGAGVSAIATEAPPSPAPTATPTMSISRVGLKSFASLPDVVEDIAASG